MSFIRGAVIRLAAVACALATGASAQQQTVGLFVNTPESQPGYTLFQPLQAPNAYLIDNGGHPVHQWTTALPPGLMAYLDPNGNLLRAAALPAPSRHPNWASAIGGGGVIEEYDWDGNLVWTLPWMDAEHFQHHDFKRMPNGNVIFISWEWFSRDEAIAAGRNPATTAAGGFWPDEVIEIQPTPPSGGVVVWEWHAMDHYIQDFDRTKANYGVIADHPELLDINTPTDDGQQDNNHCNSIDYNAELDQIVLSSRAFSEIWVIDHSTTTAEAASHSGGRQGKGGDILYRWGNPMKYGRGTLADRKLFNQHDAQWIPAGKPGAGNILIYNNGIRRQDGSSYSSIEEIKPPVNPDGSYDITPGLAYGPDTTEWTYESSPRTSFLSPIIAGTERMTNGNTLICEGTVGRLFEVTPDARTVWKWVNPMLASGPVQQGTDLTVDPRIPLQNNAIFKMRRYEADYPGLAGRDLQPTEVLELFDAPPPVPDGTNGTTALKAFKVDPAGTQIRMTWDTASCPAPDYNLYWGMLADAPTTTLRGSLCAVGTSGTRQWVDVPVGDLFILMVGVGDFDMYESSWGTNSFGEERNGYVASNECSVTTKSLADACP
jgi:hypothetical protein